MQWLLPVLVLVLFVGAITAFFFLFGGFCDQRTEPNHEITGVPAPANGKVIGKEMVDKYFPEMKLSSGNSCAVCLGAIEETHTCRRLQCEHAFHSECIQKWWLHEERTVLLCPVCKQQQKLDNDTPTGSEPCEAPAETTAQDSVTGQPCELEAGIVVPASASQNPEAWPSSLPDNVPAAPTPGVGTVYTF